MKLLLENWRKYLNEMISMEDVRRVDRTLAVPENLNRLVSLLRELGWPQEMLDIHSKDTPPFSEFRNTLLNIDKHGAPKLQMINSKDLLLDPETIADRKAKFDRYVVDKDAGKDALYFRDDPRDPREIDFSQLEPISVIKVPNGYEMADGAHRAFLARQANASLPAYVLSQETNSSPAVEKIRELFNETST
tara:strand:- start:332 stop:904 length:573 start_codon:yes stop_codon:yes gene_type:complete